MVFSCRSLKRICFLALTVTALVALFTFGAGAASYGSVSGDGAELMSAPAGRGSTVAVLSEGDLLEIVDDSDEAWFEVRFTKPDGTQVDGFMSREDTYFGSFAGEAASRNILHQTATVNSFGNLLYSAPSSDSALVTRIAGNATVTLLSTHEDGWMYVAYAADDGLFYGFLAPDFARINAIGYGTVGEIDVTLYQENSALSQATALLSAGTDVEILGIWDGWYLVRSGNAQGYVARGLIEDAVSGSLEGFGTVNADSLWLREDASPDASRIVRISEGTALEILSADEEWYGVRYNGADGFVSQEYVDFHGSISDGYVQVNTASSILRSGAGESFAPITTLDEGTLLSVVANIGDWLMVQNDSVLGFLPVSDISATNEHGHMIGSVYSTKGEEIAAYAVQFNGNPYQWGGTSLTHGADCSGFVMKVYQHFGVSLPHSSAAMRGVGYGVSASNMRPGDIVCYSGHVGIYAGNGQLINAKGEQWGITYSDVHYKQILAVRRIFD